MLSKAQEKLIRSLHRKKDRNETRQCLVEGKKLIDSAGKEIIFTFTRKDTENFDTLITTQSPQGIAGVAHVPEWSLKDIEDLPTIIVLDGVQDPGNVGSIFRACLGFNASLVLIESADPTNPKVVRASAGAIFHVPWMEMTPKEASAWLGKTTREILRLEQRPNAIAHSQQTKKPAILIAGSEGSGIHLQIDAPSLSIAHRADLESLNVAQAVTVALAFRQ